MKPDWQKKKDDEAEEKAKKVRDAMRPNFMGGKKEDEKPDTPDAEPSDAPTVGAPDWMHQAGKKKDEAPVAEAIEPEEVPEPTPVAEKPAVPETYTVQSGDSLTTIAQRLYGDGNFWVDIWKLNQDQIEDPNVIRPGQELKLPPVP